MKLIFAPWALHWVCLGAVEHVQRERPQERKLSAALAQRSNASMTAHTGQMMMSHRGQMMAHTGKMMAQAGQMVAQAGQTMAQAGQMMAHTGQNSFPTAMAGRAARGAWCSLGHAWMSPAS